MQVMRCIAARKVSWRSVWENRLVTPELHCVPLRVPICLHHSLPMLRMHI